MKRIVVGFDGTDQAGDALRLGRVLSEAAGAEMIVAVVAEVDPLLSELSPLDEARLQAFETIFAAAEEELDGFSFGRRTMTGSVPGALDLIATQTGADAIVLGSTHRGKLGRVLPGSVAERLLAGAPCAVIVAPVGYRRAELGDPMRIGVAYDGGREAGIALEVAADLARAANAPLRIITVDTTSADWVSHKAPGYESALQEYFSERLEEAMERVGSGVGVEPVLASGDPAELLAEQSADLDLLVLGSRGYGPLRRVLLGGVGRKLVEISACPLALVPRGADVEHADPAAREAPARIS